MDKKKIIRLYKDFSEGKFLSPKQKDMYEIGFPKLQYIAQKGLLKINTFNDVFDISPVVFEKSLHPRVLTDIFYQLLTLSEKSKNKEEGKFYAEAGCSIGTLIYNQSYKNNPVTNENIYIITNKTYQNFSQMPLPDISFKDITFKNDLPALFLFETFNTVAYLDYYLTPVDNTLELMVSIFGYNLKFRFEPANILLFSNKIPPEMIIGDNLVKEVLVHGENHENEIDSQVIKTYAKFFYNLLLFLSCKETMKYKTEELNHERKVLEENVSKSKSDNKNKQKIENIPSYRFIDLELTLDTYTKEYYKNESKDDSSTKSPHWRSGHWKTYYTGKKDGSEERKKVLRYIPTVWVGNPELVTEQTAFKILK